MDQRQSMAELSRLAKKHQVKLNIIDSWKEFYISSGEDLSDAEGIEAAQRYANGWTLELIKESTGKSVDDLAEEIPGLDWCL